MLEILKQLALDAIDKGSLADFCLGTVVSAAPLSVRLEEGLVLPERFLVLSRNVEDHEETGKIRIWEHTEEDKWHFYRLQREKALKAGEQVVLVKAAGGQQYVILDRVKKEGNR